MESIRKRHETNIEKLLRIELERRGYKKGTDFSQFYPIKSSFILDFAFPEQKICIEADGEHYHTSPEARKRDGFKNHSLKKLGWKVMRFWGKEIEEDVEGCVDKIEMEL